MTSSADDWCNHTHKRRKKKQNFQNLICLSRLLLSRLQTNLKWYIYIKCTVWHSICIFPKYIWSKTKHQYKKKSEFHSKKTIEKNCSLFLDCSIYMYDMWNAYTLMIKSLRNEACVWMWSTVYMIVLCNTRFYVLHNIIALC